MKKWEKRKADDARPLRPPCAMDSRPRHRTCFVDGDRGPAAVASVLVGGDGAEALRREEPARGHYRPRPIEGWGRRGGRRPARRFANSSVTRTRIPSRFRAPLRRNQFRFTRPPPPDSVESPPKEREVRPGFAAMLGGGPPMSRPDSEGPGRSRAGRRAGRAAHLLPAGDRAQGPPIEGDDFQGPPAGRKVAAGRVAEGVGEPTSKIARGPDQEGCRTAQGESRRQKRRHPPPGGPNGPPKGRAAGRLAEEQFCGRPPRRPRRSPGPGGRPASRGGGACWSMTRARTRSPPRPIATAAGPSGPANRFAARRPVRRGPLPGPTGLDIRPAPGGRPPRSNGPNPPDRRLLEAGGLFLRRTGPEGSFVIRVEDCRRRTEA